MSAKAINYYFGEPGESEEFAFFGATVLIFIDGNDGDDFILGGELGDLLRGGTGSDLVIGFSGNDTIYGDSSGAQSDLSGSADMIFAAAGADAVFAGSGNDFASGDTGDDFIDGGTGNDIIWGGPDSDDLRGGAGNDELWGGSAPAFSSTFAFNISVNYLGNSSPSSPIPVQTITGSVAFTGYGGLSFTDPSNDHLSGGDGDDALHGQLGNDHLRGGLGNDGFFFDTVLDPVNNVDRISDFSPRDDTLILSHAVFGAIKLGTLASSKFFVGSRAHDSSDRIIYAKNTGNLFYDHDGKGGDAKVLFGTINDHLKLTHDDFLVVA